jgi:hypothetical protein
MAMVDRQDASVRDIDLSMQLGAGHPMVRCNSLICDNLFERSIHSTRPEEKENTQDADAAIHLFFTDIDIFGAFFPFN